MAHVRFNQAMSNHGIEESSAHRNPVPFEHAQIELEIVSDFFAPLGFEHRAELLQNASYLRLIVGHRNVVTAVRRERKRHPEQARLFGIQAGGLVSKQKAS